MWHIIVVLVGLGPIPDIAPAEGARFQWWSLFMTLLSAPTRRWTNFSNISILSRGQVWDFLLSRGTKIKVYLKIPIRNNVLEVRVKFGIPVRVNEILSSCTCKVGVHSLDSLVKCDRWEWRTPLVGVALNDATLDLFSSPKFSKISTQKPVFFRFPPAATSRDGPASSSRSDIEEVWMLSGRWGW